MREILAGFSSGYFYNGLLRTASHLVNNGVHLVFIDTAGSGFNESPGTDNTSLENKGELQIVQKLLEEDNPDLLSTAFISPYSGQVAAAREILPKAMRISTIDSFQGQESATIILSLVRSNDDGIIGFLKDYRRMNVAITRAKEKLYIVGDSATIGNDPFYNALLTYVEKNAEYKTVWDYAV
jgi:superfamily I DNA and/or RNA helicase